MRKSRSRRKYSWNNQIENNKYWYQIHTWSNKARVPLWIRYCHLYMEGHLKLRLQSLCIGFKRTGIRLVRFTHTPVFLGFQDTWYITYRIVGGGQGGQTNCPPTMLTYTTPYPIYTLLGAPGTPGYRLVNDLGAPEHPSRSPPGVTSSR